MGRKIEARILELFTHNDRLKFSQIEDKIRERSNKVAYHLKQLNRKGILEKGGNTYKLSEASEYLIPYLSEKRSPLVVILIRIGNNRKCFLEPRGKRPFKGKLSLPGGRMLISETLKEGVSRIMREKYNVNARLDKVLSVNNEHVKRNGKIIHSFLLILVSAKTKEKLGMSDAKINKKNIISSDYELITSRTGEINIKTLNTLA
jgi:ADP-ribose pyrophosphatase YjhB (NUDIX family)